MAARGAEIQHQATSDWDPYDPAFRADPFPTYARFRRECPVGWCRRYGGFWVVSRYRDVFELARDSEAFCSARGVVIPPFPFEGRALPMEADPPEHDGLRKILMSDFSANTTAAREAMIRDGARELIDGFAQARGADLSEQYAKLLPTAVICRLLAIDELGGEFQQWAERIVYDRTGDPGRVRAAAHAIFGFFQRLIPERRRHPGDDFISVLLRAEVEGEQLSDKTVLDFCWFLLIAGLDNTAFTIRNLLLQIDRLPGLRAALLEAPERIPTAVEETLRMFSPVWGLARTATRGVAVGGQRIAEGERVLLLFASADRDEEEFPEPDRFLLGRTPNRHLAFGIGRHRCLGAHLARLEVRVAVEEILQRLPDYQVTGEVGWNELGPLPVRFSASGAS